MGDIQRGGPPAIERWENEGGADPCGPQVPGAAKACASADDARRRPARPKRGADGDAA